ncbi:dihydrolipoyl dehydrogenase [Paenibacillus sp. GCM10012307]|uniref:Dihydrolipoyl dehydrogenase n=1 Tax=Paenibacillus roseus TaxID=2798579 RepID=A0A934J9Q0_9BACL|nr:dihydrolipoyl dehydrogenase [Paenibacillus roseus]MBJ6364128.1 dihydrolipoyl dehydrogenase [Paenibacillus roseus]
MTIEVDVAVLGGGPGGYTAAIRAAQLGKKVAIIEMDKLGGTCLHKGCIPSKALLRSAEVYHTVKEADAYGITASDVTLRYEAVQERKRKTVEDLFNGLHYLMRKHGIQIINGKGRIIGPSIFSPRSGAVAVELADGEMETVVSANLIIATGSRTRHLPGLAPDGKSILSSDDALELNELPGSLLIVGGGVIGVEWASMMNDFGVDVTLVEAASRLLPGEDLDISVELERILRKRGVRILTSVKLDTNSCRYADNGTVSISAETADGHVVLEAEKMLVSVGREANADQIGLENTDIQLANGFIKINGMMQTTEPHIYAIGDVVGGLQLAHAAAHEGIIAAEHICGHKPAPLVASRVPRCVYSRPEIASVGLTEHEARKQGHHVRIGKIPFSALGKARVLGATDGFVKVVADEVTCDVLGVHMIGPHATDLIAEAVLAQVLEATPWEIGQTIHPHPTLSEALGEAALAVNGDSFVF